MDNLNERLDILKTEIQKTDFLEGKGLSNEANIHFFCYDPKDEMIVRHFISQLVTDQTLECNILERNLYKTFLSVCDERKLTDRIPGQEEKFGKEIMLKRLVGEQGKSGPAGIKAVVEKMDYSPHQLGDVVMLTGVGEAYPFVRVHSVLEAMQTSFSDVPILVMYPGTFDGRFVRLFNKLQNPYYRAFSIVGGKE